MESLEAKSGVPRRGAILAAALHKFVEQGVSRTTVDELLEVSGASVGSFYHHFGGKTDLAAQLYLDTLDTYQRDFLHRLRRARTARAGIEGIVRHHIEWVAASPDRALYLMQCREPEVDVASQGKERELRAMFYGEVLQWLGRHVEARTVRRLEPEVYYSLWLGPADQLSRIWLLGFSGALQAESERRPSGFLAARRVLGRAAWDALRTPTS